MAFFFSVQYFWSFQTFSMCAVGCRENYITAFSNGRNPLLSERITVSTRENRTLSSFASIYLIFYSNMFKTVAVHNVMGRYKYSLNPFCTYKINQMENKNSVCLLLLKLFQDSDIISYLTFQLTLGTFWDFSDEEYFSGSQSVSWACLSIQIKVANRFFVVVAKMNFLWTLKLLFYYRPDNPERTNNFLFQNHKNSK